MSNTSGESLASDQSDFDAIIVGSSPILLLEALYLSSQGERVAIFESKDRLGGAWYTKPLWGMSSVEVGCHYIDKGTHNYAFLEKFLGIELKPTPRHTRLNIDSERRAAMRQAPLTAKRKIRNFLESLLANKLIVVDRWNFHSSVTKQKIKPIIQSCVRLLRAKPYMYPVQGCLEMLNALNAKIEASGIPVFSSTSVDSVEIDDDGSRATCCVGDRVYRSESVITGQNLNLDVSVNGEPLSIEKDLYGGPENLDEGYVHVVFQVVGEKKHPFAYIDLHHANGVRRVQDVTPFSKFDPSDVEFQLLICCHILKEGFDTFGEPARILEHLVTLDLLKPGARMLEYYVDAYPTVGCIPNEQLAQLEKTLPKALKIMRTFDLGISLEHYCNRWRSLVA